MSEALPDCIEALREYLLDDDRVGATVGTRVFGGELPANEAASMPRAAVVVKPSGGLGVFGGGYTEYSDKRVDVHCYAATPHAAHDLWLEVYHAMHNLRRVVYSECLLHWARKSGGPIALRDPQTEWPFTFASWQVLSADRAA